MRKKFTWVLIWYVLIFNAQSKAMEASTTESQLDSSRTEDIETNMADCSSKELFDYLYLTQEKADLLKSSYQVLLDNGKKTMGYLDGFISKFYAKVYEESPTIEGVFSKGIHRNMNQSKLVAIAIKNIAAIAGDKEKLKEFVKYLKEDLGPKHYHVIKYNKTIERSHFLIFARILAETLAEEYVEQSEKSSELSKAKLQGALEQNKAQVCTVLEIFFQMPASPKTVVNSEDWYRLFMKNLCDAICDAQEEGRLKEKKRLVEAVWGEILEKVGGLIFDIAKKGNPIVSFLATNNEKWLIFQGGIKIISRSGISDKENKFLAIENLSVASSTRENTVSVLFTQRKKTRPYNFKAKNIQQKKELEDTVERILKDYEQMSNYTVSDKKVSL